MDFFLFYGNIQLLNRNNKCSGQSYEDNLPVQSRYDRIINRQHKASASPSSDCAAALLSTGASTTKQTIQGH